MKLAMIANAAILGLSLLVLVALRIITHINPSIGTFEGDPIHAWAGTAGFGALYALVISAVALLSLGAAKRIKYWRIGRSAARADSPLPVQSSNG